MKNKRIRTIAITFFVCLGLSFLSSLSLKWVYDGFEDERVQAKEITEITEQKDYLESRQTFYFREYEMDAVITEYNPVAAQCDDTPDITASNKKVEEGMIANNCLPFGTLVGWEGRMFVVEDRMNGKHGCERFDILSFDIQEAISFGVKNGSVKIYEFINL